MRRWLIGPGALTLAAVILILWLNQVSTPYDTDLFWQIPEGVQILHGHFPTTVPYAIHAGYWVDHEWLFETVAAGCWQRGIYPAFALLCLAAFTLAPAFVYVLLRGLSFSDVAAAASGLVFAASETVGPAVRAQTFIYYLFAFELFILWRGLKRPWVLLPLSFVWANVHASAVMAVAIPLIFAVGQMFESKSRMAVRSLYGAAFAFIGTLLTPIHIHLWTYSLLKSVPTFASAFIQEWRRCRFLTAWHGSSSFPCDRLRYGAGEARSIPTTPLVVAFFILAADHIRHTPFLAPRLDHDDRHGGRADERPRLDRESRLPFAGILLVPIVSSPCSALDPPGARLIPLVRGLRRRTRGASRHCAGTYMQHIDGRRDLHFKDLPVRVLIDAHGDPFGLRTWSDYIKITTLQPGWLAALRSERTKPGLAEDQTPIAEALDVAPGWKVSASNGDVDVIERTQNEPARRDPAIC